MSFVLATVRVSISFHLYSTTNTRPVGQIGLLERENAAILNASILTFARATVASYRAVLARLGLNCPLFLTQFDGTLLPASKAAEIPVRTFSNGPTNSIRGASYLAGIGHGKYRQDRSVVVVDIGGTTTDVGVLLPSGFPRQAAAFTTSTSLDGIISKSQTNPRSWWNPHKVCFKLPLSMLKPDFKFHELVSQCQTSSAWA